MSKMSAAHRLPFEILEEIFSYLHSLEDRKAAGSVCAWWHQLYIQPCFRATECVRFRCEREFRAFQQFNHQFLKYENFEFYQVDITRDSLPFWQTHGENIRSLSLTECYIGDTIFAEALSYCTSIEALIVKNCKDLLMSGMFLYTLKSNPMLRNSFRMIHTLDFSDNRYLSDAILYTILMMCPMVSNLILTGCQISFHNGMYHKFYPSSGLQPSESVTTFLTLMKAIESIRGASIKHITLNNTLLDNNSLVTVVMSTHTRIETLNVRNCLQLTDQGFHHLCTLSDIEFITELDMGGCDRLSDRPLIEICVKMPQLKKLSVQRCKNVTDWGLSSLGNLIHLTTFRTGTSEVITCRGIVRALASQKNNTLVELTMSYLGGFGDENLIKILECLPKLKYLDVSGSWSAVTDRSLQAMFLYNRNLRTLNISGCGLVTDSGLTGIGVLIKQNEGTAPPLRIPLGSRQEIGIRVDAEIREQVKGLCEKNEIVKTGLSLANLKGLNRLVLKGCVRITDMSLQHAFLLQELRVLDMRKCQQITHDGLQHLVRNCITIEQLDLNFCHNVNDEAVKLFCKLPRLKRLRLGSDSITDHIVSNLDGCRLTELDVRHCGKLTGGHVSQLRRIIPSLRSLKYQETQSQVTETEVKVKPPAPPSFKLWKWCSR